MQTQITMERIDGTDYIVGSRDHAAAKAARRARQDAAYVQHHHKLLERNLRLVREMPGLDDRVRTDANYSAFLARDLLYVRAEVERVIYDELRAAQYIPAEGGHPRGAESYATRKMDEKGEAAIATDLGGDAPRVDVDVDEEFGKYVFARAAYGYSVLELERAAMSGTPLVRWKAEACGTSIARQIDKVMRVGNALTGHYGMFNQPGITVHTLTQGEWLTETVANILADLREIEQAVIAATRQNHPQNGYVLMLPTAFEGRLASTLMDPAVQNGDTIKTWFLRNSRLIKNIVGWIKVDDATASTDTAVADPPMGILYPADAAGSVKADVRAFRFPVSIPYEEMPPEVRNLEWLVNAFAKFGGVESRQPKFSLYIENLD